MSESTTPETAERPEFRFPDVEAGETFVRTIMDHSGFCYWCLTPLEPNPVVQFPNEPEGWPLETSDTFTEYGAPVEVYPPGAREKQTICGNCGVIDVDVKESRTKETTRQALTHVCSILESNGSDVNLLVADETVTEFFAKGHTGQFARTLGTAIHRSTQ